MWTTGSYLRPVTYTCLQIYGLVIHGLLLILGMGPTCYFSLFLLFKLSVLAAATTKKKKKKKEKSEGVNETIVACQTMMT